MTGSTNLPPRAAGMVLDSTVTPGWIARGDALASVTAPTLVVNAAHSRLASQADARAFVRRLPDARLVDVATGGHVLVGNVAHLRRVLAEFFDQRP